MSTVEFDNIGKFEIRRKIGSGASGDVYEAFDTGLKRLVALKIQFARLAADPQMREMFVSEASKAAHLEHPNIVKVFDSGQFHDRPYFVMEYLPERSLKRLLREEGNLDPAQALNISLQIARALTFAHAQIEGFIHRDIKPDNILFDQHGIPKVTDFGIARGSAGSSQNVTIGYGPVGTPEYMAPEQIDAKSRPESDWYSLGIVLYELLTGKPPFTGDNPIEIFQKHLKEEVPAGPLAAHRVHRDIKKLILDLLEKDPKKRVFKGTELESRIERLLETLYPSFKPATRTVRPLPVDGKKREGRNPALVGALVSVAAALVIAGVAVLAFGIRDKKTAPLAGTWIGQDSSSGIALKLTIDGNGVAAASVGSQQGREYSYRLESDSTPYVAVFFAEDDTCKTQIALVNPDTIRLKSYGKLLWPTLQSGRSGITSFLLNRELSKPPRELTQDKKPSDTAQPAAEKDRPSNGRPPVSDSSITSPKTPTKPESPTTQTPTPVQPNGKQPVKDSVESDPPRESPVTEPPPPVASPPPVSTAPSVKNMSLIRKGSFIRGDDRGFGEDNEQGSLSDSVEVERLMLDEKEVSQAQYRAIMGDNPSKTVGDELPVTNISWNDAKRYCEKIGKRLPTEVEWEYAAKTSAEPVDGRHARYPWGEQISSSRAVYNTSGPSQVGGRRQGSHGLYDMSGNVAEWCEDTYTTKPTENGQAVSGQKTVKGGSYRSNAGQLRSAAREGRASDRGYDDVGCRCAY